MTSYLGAAELPVPAGVVGTAFADPMVSALLDFLGHCIKAAVDTRLNQIRTGDAAILDACPEANRHDYDPRQSFVRKPTPALYIWWGGRSKNVEHSTIRNRRERDLNLLYVCPPVLYPDGGPVFAGLPGAVDAAILEGSDRGYHPTYGYQGDPAGTVLVRSLAPAGTLGWEYTGGQIGILEPIPRKRRNADPNHQEDAFPALQGTLRVYELRTDSLADVEELGDGQITISSDGVPYFTRVLRAL